MGVSGIVSENINMNSARPPFGQLILAFATLYLVWGSTYLAIRVGVADLPPNLFAGVRFLISAAILLALARGYGQAMPNQWAEWKTIAVMGCLLMAGGNGLVVWGEQWVPSNQAALLVATTALWIAGFGALGQRGTALGRRDVLGLAIGLLGVAALLWPQGGLRLDHFGGQLAVLLGSLFWSMGAIYGKRRQPSTPLLMASAMQMLIGGVLLSVIGLCAGELPRWQWTLAGSGALAYLIVFGTLGFLAFTWLLHRVSPTQLGTYAYVNPAVAVLLGWWLLNEVLSATQWLGMAVILVGVILVSQRTPAESNG